MGSASKGIPSVGAGGGGRDPDTREGKGAETVGEVETDLEVEVYRQDWGRGLTWRGREGGRNQRGRRSRGGVSA